MLTTIPLRLATGLGLMLAVGALGYWHRSPWIIPVLGAAFVPLYAIGKWSQWAAAWRDGGPARIALAALTTFPIQCLLVAIGYLLGYGLGALIDPGRTSTTLEAWDLWFAASVFAYGAIGGASATIIEARSPTAAAWKNPSLDLNVDSGPEADHDDAPVEFEAEALTADNFFQPPSNDALIIAIDERIAETEARLGVALPDGLKALYARRNGGPAGTIMAPIVDDPGPERSDWRGVFMSGLSDLTPVEALTTLRKGHPEALNRGFVATPEDAERLVVIAGRDLYLVCLDYSRPGSEAGSPSVIANDFSVDDEPELRFHTFDAFLAALRRVRDD